MKNKIITLCIVSMFLMIGSVSSVQINESKPKKENDTIIATITGSMWENTRESDSITGVVSIEPRFQRVKLVIMPTTKDYEFILYRMGREQRFWYGSQVLGKRSLPVIAAFSFLPTAEEIQDPNPVRPHPDMEYFSGGIKSPLGFYQIKGQIEWKI